MPKRSVRSKFIELCHLFYKQRAKKIISYPPALFPDKYGSSEYILAIELVDSIERCDECKRYIDKHGHKYYLTCRNHSLHADLDLWDGYGKLLNDNRTIKPYGYNRKAPKPKSYTPVPGQRLTAKGHPCPR